MTKLEEKVRQLYDDRALFVKGKNIELERQYFTENVASIPLGEMMAGASFEEHFSSYKSVVKRNKPGEIELAFQMLQDYLLFTAGHDLMFKKKLEADIFTSEPIEEFIYPLLDKAVKEKYNDVSVMEENPNYEENVKGIDKVVYTYFELQSLLYLLYWNDFQFPNGWEGLCGDVHEDVIAILESSGITIGDFLHALIDYKCKKMTEVLSEITDPKLKSEYLKKVEDLKEEKHAETKTFTHVSLPITYFLNHTMLDFIKNGDGKSSILDEEPTTPNGRKIVL